MNVSLSSHFEALVTRLVASGRYRNQSEVIRAELRKLEAEITATENTADINPDTDNTALATKLRRSWQSTERHPYTPGDFGRLARQMIAQRQKP